MSLNAYAAAGILLPLLGTSLGAAPVFFMRGGIKPFVEKALLGFASGVMIAASVWSLLIPAIEMAAARERSGWVQPSVGFILGILFLVLLDKLIPHLHPEQDSPEGMKTGLKKTTMLTLAVTLHNIPEGMAVGVVFAGALMGNAGITMTGAVVLALGIAIQNFPEGAIVSMPLRGGGMPKFRAFAAGVLSGAVEPVAAAATLLLTNAVVTALPYLLSFAAGAMIYVVVEELIPESQTGSRTDLGVIGVAAGFIIMMILDVALG